jgi:hypothetical protein
MSSYNVLLRHVMRHRAPTFLAAFRRSANQSRHVHPNLRLLLRAAILIHPAIRKDRCITVLYAKSGLASTPDAALNITLQSKHDGTMSVVPRARQFFGTLLASCKLCVPKHKNGRLDQDRASRKAERGRFELPLPENRQTGFRNQRVQPLCHLSGR